METLLELKDICKSFSGIQVLHDVNLNLYAGEVLCLVGENGAGKSTLIKILSGAEKPDSGTLTLFGAEYKSVTPNQAIKLGIATIYQDVDLVDTLTVADNIYLGAEIASFGFVDTIEQIKQAQNLLDSLNIRIDASVYVEELSPGQKQTLQLAKSLHKKARIIIMDEPTVSLGEEETTALMELVEKLRHDGMGIIYISHYLDEVFQLGDRATVLKDGHSVGDKIIKDTTQEELINAMVGRSASSFYKKESSSTGDNALELKGFARGKVVRDVSFTVSHGEIFGLGGLVGAGRTELVRMLFGADKGDKGRLIYKGTDITPSSPRDAIRKGICLISEDRKEEGLFLERSTKENITITHNDTKMLLDLGKERSEVEQSINQLRIKVFDQTQEVGNLSGGNQQKVIISRWLMEDGDIYILDEPTKGVDIGAREEIYKIMEQLTKSGKVVIMVSSNMPELLSMSDRIGIMREGSLVGIVSAKEATEDALLKQFIGI